MICFVKTRPAVPVTARQRANMLKFKAIASIWRALSPESRQRWRDAARLAKLTITPYNLFVYSMMQPDRSTIKTIEHQSGIDLTVQL